MPDKESTQRKSVTFQELMDSDTSNPLAQALRAKSEGYVRDGKPICTGSFYGKHADVSDPPDFNFRDSLSIKDWTITGLCQTCQDEMYEEPECDHAWVSLRDHYIVYRCTKCGETMP